MGSDSTKASKLRPGEAGELADDYAYERIIKLLAPHGAKPWLEWRQESSSWIKCKYGLLNSGRLTRGYPFGLIPDKKLTSWFVIDIDNKPNRCSQYHPARDQNALTQIRKILEEQGIEGTITIRSSDSGGIHLWAPLPEVPTFQLAVWLRRLFTDAGFVLEPGTLEIFPNVPRPGSDHQGIRIPLLTKGSFVLDFETLIPIHNNIEAFCDDWERLLSWNEDFRLPNLVQAATGYFRRLPEAKKRLEQGFTAKGQTDELAGQAAYIAASEGLSGAALRSRMNALLKQAPNCKELSGHWHEISQGKSEKWWRHFSDKAAKACLNTAPNYSRKARKTNPHYNDELARRKRCDVLAAVNALLAQGRKFSTITDSRNAVISEVKLQGGKMSINTVRKHDDLTMRLLATDQDRSWCETRCTAKEFTPLASTGVKRLGPWTKATKPDADRSH